MTREAPWWVILAAAAAGVGAVITLGWLCILLAVYLGT